MSAALRSRFTPLGLAAAGIVLLLLLLFVFPMASAALHAVSDFGTALTELRANFLSGTLGRVLGNTAIVVLGGALLALLVGTLLAYIHERTDAAIGIVGELLPLAPLLVPSIAGVIGWAVLLDPRAGLLNVLLRQILGLFGIATTSGPIDIYSAGGLVTMTGIYLAPYVYLIVAAAFQRLDPELYEASRVAGASGLRTFWRVTLPAVRPAIAGAFFVAVIAGVGMFSVPIVLGTAARMEVLSVHLFRQFDSFPPHTAYALVLSAMLVVAVQALLLFERMAIAASPHAVVGGRGVRAGRRPLGRWKAPARIATLTYLALTSVLPVCGLFLVSLQSFWTPVVKWSQLSFANYVFVLIENAPTSRALVTSLGLGAIAASVAILGAGLVLLRGRSGGGGTRLADAIMSLPGTVPHTVIGASFLVAFSAAPFRLYGSLTILLLAYVLMAMPFAARAANAAAGAISAQLAEASRVAGAGEARTLLRVMVPLAWPGLLAGWIIVFIHTVGEVTASSLLAGARNPVIGRTITELWIFGNFPQVAALSLIVSVVTSFLVAVLLIVSRRNVAATLG